MTDNSPVSAFLPVASLEDPTMEAQPRIFAFEGDHAAIVYQPQLANTLVRIHSECLTGDVFGSLKCDCGDQLKTAQSLMEKQGGIIIYLRQEGRGVGLFEKIKSYGIQETGLDTFQAGRKLGHQDDLRDYAIAVHMLKTLGVTQCRLLTNNPDKVAALRDNGIDVTSIPMPASENQHNRPYIIAKKRNGHEGLIP
jgi:GTP cyclohydrolase II